MYADKHANDSFAAGELTFFSSNYLETFPFINNPVTLSPRSKCHDFYDKGERKKFNIIKV